MISKTKNGYYKNSFNRFGDDLCELILNYLPINEKLSFECISKQWKRLVFNKHKILGLYCMEIKTEEDPHLILSKDLCLRISKHYWNNRYVFNILFKKFKSINVLKIKNLLSIEIFNELNHLKYLQQFSYSSSMSETDLIKFGYNFGKRLKYINIIGNEDKDLVKLFYFTPNLVKVNLKQINEDFLAISLPKLQEIFIRIVFTVQELRSFANKYCKQIKKFKTTLYYGFKSSSDDMNKCFVELSRFISLETLDLTTYYIFSDFIGSSDHQLIRVLLRSEITSKI